MSEISYLFQVLGEHGVLDAVAFKDDVDDENLFFAALC